MTGVDVARFVIEWAVTTLVLSAAFVGWIRWRSGRWPEPQRLIEARMRRVSELVDELAVIEDEVLGAFPPDQRRRVRARIRRAYVGGIDAVIAELRRVVRAFVGSGLRRFLSAARLMMRVLSRVGVVATLHAYETRRERAHECVDVGRSFRPRAPGIGSAQLFAAASSRVLTVERGLPV